MTTTIDRTHRAVDPGRSWARVQRPHMIGDLGRHSQRR